MNLKNLLGLNREQSNRKVQEKAKEEVRGGGEVFIGLFKDDEVNKELEEASKQDRSSEAETNS